MSACPICGEPVPDGRGRVYDKPQCRKAAERQRERDRRAEAFRRDYEAHYGPMPEASVASVEEVHRLLWMAARQGSVQAAQTLLVELRRGGTTDHGPESDFIDELAQRRERGKR